MLTEVWTNALFRGHRSGFSLTLASGKVMASSADNFSQSLVRDTSQ